jgi:hypothetical protein
VNKKEQKNFDLLGALARRLPQPPFSKSFLPPGGPVLFFKKDVLAS